MIKIELKIINRICFILLNIIMWNQLSAFVEKVCAGRDHSHGHMHMEKVAQNALFIYNHTQSKLKNDHTWNLTMTVAWCHDINDHKYNDMFTLQMCDFFRHYYTESEIKLILNIIDRISYSKENNTMKQNKKLDWLEVLGDTGCFVRDIVSDADKLEAIGKIGMERCIEYTKHHYFEENHQEIPYQELVVEVVKHANEKLLRLKDEFIRTNIGKDMAKPLHDEMITMLADFLSQYSWKERK